MKPRRDLLPQGVGTKFIDEIELFHRNFGFCETTSALRGEIAPHGLFSGNIEIGSLVASDADYDEVVFRGLAHEHNISHGATSVKVADA